MGIAAAILFVVFVLLIVAKVTVWKDDKKFDPDSELTPIKKVEMSDTQSMYRTAQDNMWFSQTRTVINGDFPKKKKKKLADKTLKQQLDEAVEIEDYETAAKLRDLINKIKIKK